MDKRNDTALLTDFYQLTMQQAYFLEEMNGIASFEFFVRRLPPQRNFLVAAGLEQVLDYLSQLRFEEDELAWLDDSGMFGATFIDSLRELRFTGDVDALPEGTVFFADEPLLRVTAPLREAQLVESRVSNLLHYQTLVASKAARIVFASGGRRLVDFGLRRAHGAEAGLLSARASYLAGFDSTATTEAGRRFGIPVTGTMAHSFVQAHERERDAFLAFVHAFPDSASLLIDTYDTEACARQVVNLARWLRTEEELHIDAVRIDSGDLAESARQVRRILDEGDCRDVRIIASGNLDEYAIEALVQAGAPIDAFGVGTRMNTSADAPFLDSAYKLVEYAGRPCRKRSTGKATWPGRKQVYRRWDLAGMLAGDTLALAAELVAGEPMLKPVMRAGERLQEAPALDEMRAYARAQIEALPQPLRMLQASPRPYQIGVSDALQQLARKVDERQRLQV